MNIAMLNSRIMKLEELDKSWLNYGTYFGDGVYEVIRSYNGRIFALDQHLKRLKYSIEQLELNAIEIGEIRDKVIQGFEAAGYENAKIYLQITRGCGERSHSTTAGLVSDFLMLITKLPDPSNQKQNGIKVITYPDLRWKRCDIKSLNLLANVMATRQAEKKGCQEAILVNQEGFITEGAASGFFAVIENKVYTTPLGANILPSITRQFIEKCCNDLAVQFIEEQITPEQAKNADELFMGVTTKDVVGIIEFDGKIIANGKVGKITQKLIDQFKNYT